MVKRSKRVVFKRKIRNQKRQLAGFSFSANKHLDRHVFRRWQNVRLSQRFAGAWISLLVLLILTVSFQIRSLGSYYLSPSPVAGGLYSEGLIGTFSNANPIYATNVVDASVSKLLFSGLITFDSNNKPVGDLAKSWTVNADATEYVVTLRPNLYWHDGKKLTADDVVFTFQMMQNPDAQSPFLGNWTGVTVTKVTNSVIKFNLPNSFGSFINSLTVGILPKHILGSVKPQQMRSVGFNTLRPVGTGPFVFNDISSDNDGQIIEFKKNDKYHLGSPKLDAITLRTYSSQAALQNALMHKKIITAAGMSLRNSEISSKNFATSFNLMSANMLFLNNSTPVLKDINVRKALLESVNMGELMQSVGYSGIPVREPILQGQIGYNPAYSQNLYNISDAKALLDKAGWVMVPGKQFRQKDGSDLTLNITYQQNDELFRVIDVVRQDWSNLGVKLNIVIDQNNSTVPKFLDTHQYDVLLYGINIGSDPDVFAYWDSSQIDKKTPIHLNLSEYSSKTVDLALEGARTNSDPALRAAKYQSFLSSWQADTPAIGLYQPRYLYVSNQQVYGMNVNTSLNVPVDRFNNVNMWMVNTVRTKKS
jgi:peptide/nickel transport system substrate-binding protein